MKKTWQETKVGLGGAIIVSVITLVLGVFVGANWDNFSSQYFKYLGISTSGSGQTLDWSPLNELYSELTAKYDGDINSTDIIEGAKKGLVDAVGDKYTAYMGKEDAQEYVQGVLHGQVGAGVGIEFGQREGYNKVLRTLPDNPAREAGILAGDIIYKVNGEEVWDWPSDDVSSKLRGEAGSTVSLTVVRNGEEHTYELTREEINNVSADIAYDDTTAIITVTRFDSDTGQIVRGFAKDFPSHNVQKIIVDLRGNGGGYVSAAQEMLSLWIDGEKILTQRSIHHTDSPTYALRGNASLKNIPTVVLVNGTTASASEIFAGALQDYQLATIIGEKTYGKGVVQTMIDLSNGAMLKVTTAHWYTPQGRTINGTGIEPDQVVERTYDDINTGRDPQMDAAKAH